MSEPTVSEDIALLKRALEKEDLRDSSREAFEDMLERIEAKGMTLSDKQRAWVLRALDVPEYENLVSSGKVPIGKPVELPWQLRPENLPKKPPGRK